MSDSDRPALDEIEITPAMMEAGLEAISGSVALDFCDYMEGASERLLAVVFRAMTLAHQERLESRLLGALPTDAHPQ